MNRGRNSSRKSRQPQCKTFFRQQILRLTASWRAAKFDLGFRATTAKNVSIEKLMAGNARAPMRQLLASPSEPPSKNEKSLSYQHLEFVDFWKA